MYQVTSEIDRILEDDPQTEAELAFVDPLPRQAGSAGDGHEVFVAADRAVWQAQVRCVGEIERFHPELHFHAFGERELAEQAEVPISETRPTQHVAASIPEAGLGDIG